MKIRSSHFALATVLLACGVSVSSADEIGNVLSPIMVTLMLNWFGNWNASLYLMGGLFLAGAVACASSIRGSACMTSLKRGLG